MQYFVASARAHVSAPCRKLLLESPTLLDFTSQLPDWPTFSGLCARTVCTFECVRRQMAHLESREVGHKVVDRHPSKSDENYEYTPKLLRLHTNLKVR